MVITVQNRIARVSGTPEIVCGNSGFTITFSFDSEWNDYPEKTAQFRFYRSGKAETVNVAFTGTVCAVPVLSDIDFVEIGVTAGDIRTASPARIPCIRCITDIPSAEYVPQRDIYNEIMDALKLPYDPPPELEDGEFFIVTAEGDYVVALDGTYIIAKE